MLEREKNFPGLRLPRPSKSSVFVRSEILKVGADFAGGKRSGDQREVVSGKKKNN